MFCLWAICSKHTRPGHGICKYIHVLLLSIIFQWQGRFIYDKFPTPSVGYTTCLQMFLLNKTVIFLAITPFCRPSYELSNCLAPSWAARSSSEGLNPGFEYFGLDRILTFPYIVQVAPHCRIVAPFQWRWINDDFGSTPELYIVVVTTIICILVKFHRSLETWKLIMIFSNSTWPWNAFTELVQVETCKTRVTFSRL